MKLCGFKTTRTITIHKYYLLVCVNLYKHILLHCAVNEINFSFILIVM